MTARRSSRSDALSVWGWRMSESSIEWTDCTWNPVVGCTPVSPGCLNCYAADMAGRRLSKIKGQEKVYHGITVSKLVSNNSLDHGAGILETGIGHRRHIFNGTVRCLPERLAEPLSWRTPRMVFVNSMSDLFHEAVPFEFVDQVFAVMALCPRHTFQVLTKRPERMQAYLASIDDYSADVDGSWGMMRLGNAAGKLLDGPWIHGEGARFRKAIENFISDAYETDDEDTGYEAKEVAWPLPNVWLGTSVEDQLRSDLRIPWLLKCPAAVRFLSVEPQLGLVDLSRFLGCSCGRGEFAAPETHAPCCGYRDRIDWVIQGGESGPYARTFEVEWARALRDQCRAAGVAYFLKQLGAECVCRCNTGRIASPRIARSLGVGGSKPDPCPKCGFVILKNRKGADVSEWPEDLRGCREMPRGANPPQPLPQGGAS